MRLLTRAHPWVCLNKPIQSILDLLNLTLRHKSKPSYPHVCLRKSKVHGCRIIAIIRTAFAYRVRRRANSRHVCRAFPSMSCRQVVSCLTAKIKELKKMSAAPTQVSMQRTHSRDFDALRGTQTKLVEREVFFCLTAWFADIRNRTYQEYQQSRKAGRPEKDILAFQTRSCCCVPGRQRRRH